jgi:hypothetical protein
MNNLVLAAVAAAVVMAEMEEAMRHILKSMEM